LRFRQHPFMPSPSPLLPASIVDCHHHFLAPDQSFHATLSTIGAPAYTADQYRNDCGHMYDRIQKTVHVEAIADDGESEVKFVEALANAGACKVAAIVANCNLAAEDAADKLDQLKAASARVKGVRLILDYDGPFDGDCPTHIARKSDDADYLRDPAVAPAFERGFALLAERGLSFDLQCATAQMDAAHALLSRHPDVPVCIDHLGKPWRLAADGGEGDAAKLATWREKMTKLASLPNTCCKLSMLGNAVRGWTVDAAKEALIKELVLEVIALFGPQRCMFNSNWHVNASISNSDAPGIDADELTVAWFFNKFAEWTSHLSEEDREWLFRKSAERFYRLG